MTADIRHTHDTGNSFGFRETFKQFCRVFLPATAIAFTLFSLRNCRVPLETFAAKTADQASPSPVRTLRNSTLHNSTLQNSTLQNSMPKIPPTAKASEANEEH
jgi:hypothetical protein